MQKGVVVSFTSMASMQTFPITDHCFSSHSPASLAVKNIADELCGGSILGLVIHKRIAFSSGDLFIRDL